MEGEEGMRGGVYMHQQRTHLVVMKEVTSSSRKPFTEERASLIASAALGASPAVSLKEFRG